jgi:hypothetical protein
MDWRKHDEVAALRKIVEQMGHTDGLIALKKRNSAQKRS